MADLEMWSSIAGYEGLYEVSSHGRVRSLDRIVTRKHGGRVVEQPLKGVVLTTVYNVESGYGYVNLCKSGRCISTSVHSLVADAFLPPPLPGQTQVCHEDGDVTNAHHANLRRDTPVGNARDRYKHGTDARGENNPRATLTEDRVREVKKLIATHGNLKKVSDITGVNYSTVRAIGQGRRWGWIP